MNLLSSNQILSKEKKIFIGVSRFNEIITEKLLSSAYDLLLKNGCEEKKITVAKVPGAFELPLIIQRAAKKNYDGIIALGCVIRGETKHFDFVCSESISGTMQQSLKYEVPISLGILTTENLEQAMNRAGGKHGNKGEEAAVTLIEMINLMETIKND